MRDRRIVTCAPEEWVDYSSGDLTLYRGQGWEMRVQIWAPDLRPLEDLLDLFLWVYSPRRRVMSVELPNQVVCVDATDTHRLYSSASLSGDVVVLAAVKAPLGSSDSEALDILRSVRLEEG
jgi:hypothetical protein